MQAGERQIERTLAKLRREASTAQLLEVDAPYRANIAVLDRILVLLARGRQSDADALGPVAGRLQHAANRELAAAGAAYRDRAAHAVSVAQLGSGAVVLALVALFAVFYLRSRSTAGEARRLTEENAKLQVLDAQLQVIQRLARAAEYRDDDTGEHTRRVGDLSAHIGAALGLPDEEIGLLREAAPLHDVGKVGIPDGILLKPGRLTKDEFDRMKAHATLGAGMLAGREFPLLAMAEEIALTHHERWDGSGYPEGLSGAAIPLVGRIVAVADVFDALTHRRPYKEAWTVGAAVAEITAQSGRQFDPEVVSAFMLVLPDYLASAVDARTAVLAEPCHADELTLVVPEAFATSSD
jgi:HD-GYP domain-containing protein (c-di-GMP phosphodiesterase class II)